MKAVAEAARPYASAEAAETYSRLAVPLQFAAPARDLVTAIALRRGQRVLDIGTGTGAAATAAADAVGSAGLVVGMDASLTMLRRRPPGGAMRPVAARAPALPFRPAGFDAAIASFVLSHIDDPVDTLRQVGRVLRPGARIGVSGWGGETTAAESLWNDVARRFVNVDELKQAVCRIIPHGERFSTAGGLACGLRDAGHDPVAVSGRAYTIRMGRDDYLAVRTASVEGHLLRQRLGDGDWPAFVRALADAFRRIFGDEISYTREVHFAIAATVGR